MDDILTQSILNELKKSKDSHNLLNEEALEKFLKNDK